MKKTYIAPELLVSEIQEQTIIAGSNVGLGDGDNVGNETPKEDDVDNFFVKGNNSTWSEW